MERFKAEPQPAPNVFTIQVTPDLAEAWLEHDTHNRRSAGRPIAMYIRDMSRPGAWRETGETVTWTGEFRPEWPYISEGAILVNGGHRLRAATLSEHGFPVYVVFDVPLEGQDKTDRGRKRTHAEQLALHGESNSPQLAAIIRRYYGWQQGVRSYTSVLSAKVATDTELDELIEATPDIREAARFAHQHKVEHLPSSLVGVAWLLFHRLSEDDCEMFFERLSKGIDLQEDSPIWHLRERLKKFAADPGKPREGYLFAHVVKAWNQFRDGAKVTNFRVRTGGAAPEPFPEPH